MREYHLFYEKTDNWLFDALYRADCFLVDYYVKGLISFKVIPESKCLELEVKT